MIVMQVAGALHYMHGKGLMHRDVKLENIMLMETDGSFTAKLTGVWMGVSCSCLDEVASAIPWYFCSSVGYTR